MSEPSHPSQINGDGDGGIDDEGQAYTEPVVPALADVNHADACRKYSSQQAFPLQSEEASELFRQGQLITGPLAKQPGADACVYRVPEAPVVHAT